MTNPSQPLHAKPLRTLILGAAGRDFHDFLTHFRDNPNYEVMAFTATQIPFIEMRHFPAELAGPRYPQGIPIYAQARLNELLRQYQIDAVFLAYSDIAHLEVMHLAAQVQSQGASFSLLGCRQTQLRSRLPVIAVTATRTGAGKSSLALWLALHLREQGIRAGVLRHPMPYGDLNQQRVQRFATVKDLDDAHCTLEEREEYTPYLENGLVIHAGVDYARILAHAEHEAQLILWDGGNNDSAFVRPNLLITMTDARRPGSELNFYPGESNVRSADVLVINKVDETTAEGIADIHHNLRGLNGHAPILETSFSPHLNEADTGKLRALMLNSSPRALVIEDAPSVTHGGAKSDAGMAAALAAGVSNFVDPRLFARGSIAEAYRTFPHMGWVLPSLGYSNAQRADLAATIAACQADLVVDGSPAGIAALCPPGTPVFRTSYRFGQRRGPPLENILANFLRTFALPA